MPRIAHISDIHFGYTFVIPIWLNVSAEIVQFNPDMIIASGDFIDNPDPLLLLAVKCELEALRQECASKPELFFVPGNHDLLDSGNFWRPFAAG